MRVEKDFYSNNNAVELAPLLLGKLLCRHVDEEVLKYRITETEAYLGEADTACHAHCGKTARNSVIYEEGGVAYVYLCYGIHNLLNIVTGEKDEPEAVLIRGVEGFDGPGKLTKQMRIDRTLNGVDLTISNQLWLEDDGVQFEYTTAPRVGIDYARDEDRKRLWRFLKLETDLYKNDK